MGCDYGDWEKLRDNLRVSGREISTFIEGCAKELAARLLRGAIKKTKVRTGTLQKGWTGGKQSKAAAYVNSLSIEKREDTYIVEIVNPVEYASYVEFGHRKSNGKGWVKGKRMLTLSEEEVQRIAPQMLERKIKRFLEGCMK